MFDEQNKGELGFALLLLLTIGRMTSLVREGIYLFLFFVGVGIWQLGAARILYIFVNNPIVCANIEYMAIFFFPVPFAAFLSIELNIPSPAEGMSLSRAFTVMPASRSPTVWGTSSS